ncbi:MAG: branched-chain amino acid ABC transporter permease [Beijerinckiaceae bacterium]
MLIPWTMTDFYTFQSTQILIYSIAILGLNILTGFNGQISLGHGAFYAIGAYAVAILISQCGLPYWMTIPLAAVICFIVGFAFGFPAMRLEGPYLALATFALALAVPQLLKYDKFETLTGGVQGIFIAKPDSPFRLHINPDQWLYYFTLALTILLFFLANNLLHGRVGRAITAIRDHQVAAEAMGVNADLYKALTFGVSAMYTGVAGGLSAIVIQFVAPDSFALFLSIFLLVGLVVGGVGAIPGAFIGAAFIVIIPNLAASTSKLSNGSINVPPDFIYGLFLIVMMYLMPNGVWGALARAWKRLESLWQKPSVKKQPASAPR